MQDDDPQDDFAMTYPCFLLLTASGNAEGVVMDGVPCVCLFTDQDLTERFYKERYGEAFVTREVEVMRCDGAREVTELLSRVEQTTTLAIDPRLGRALVTTIEDFVKEISRSENA
jgi:hypothetical protein